MFYYIIGFLLILIILLLIGYFLKRKYYKDIDRLEDWKMDIMNRPVTDELSKVKQLNMTGETERLFERWRQQWDEILTVHLPDVEEYFIDAEHFIDKYRFNNAKLAMEKISEKLFKAEDKIEVIIAELNDLVGSEEKSRQEIARLKNEYREARKTLLARGHSYGGAAANLELQLDETVNMFELFEEKTTSGNYLEAREIVLQISETLANINKKMDIIPQFIIECTTTIPSLLKQLTDGYKEMVNDGYILIHIQIERELDRLNKELSTYLHKIEQTNIEGVEKGLEDIKESIELLFDLLEKEVHAKHYVIKNKDNINEKIKSAKEKNAKLAAETKIVKKIYHLSAEDVAAYERLEKQLTQLLKRFETLEIKISKANTAQTELSKELTEVEESLRNIVTDQDELFEMLSALREDEIIAREQVDKMSDEIKAALRLVKRSNIPGLPKQYEYLLQDAQASIYNVTSSLEEKPLNMDIVQKNLQEALSQINNLTKTTEEMIEDVLFVELIIQYGNRYRSSYPSLAKQLDDAEAHFRSYDYKEALEIAAAAIEDVEPGSLKHVEQIISDQYNLL